MGDGLFPYLMVASRNNNKVKQFKEIFQEIFQEMSIEVKSLLDYSGIPETIEDQPTYEGNARKKAEEIASILNIPVISDDSGLEVQALDGRPGVYSARFAGTKPTDFDNNRKLLSEMKEIPINQRQAKYVCVLALAIPGRETLIIRDELKGIILESPKGSNGFGYDPLFYLPEEDKTMAELSSDKRNQMCHRGKALRKMIQVLKGYIDENINN